MCPLGIPNRQRLDADSGLKQHIIGDIGQVQFSIEKIDPRSAQQDRDIGVLSGAKIAPGATTDQVGTADGVMGGNPPRKRRTA